MSRVEGTGGSKEIKYVKSKVSNDSSGKVLFNYEQNNDSEFQSHTVSSGETAFSITRKYDITIYQLAEANGWEVVKRKNNIILKKNGKPITLKEGMKVNIPVADSKQAHADNEFKIYSVKPSDSPFKIADENEVSIRQLAAANGWELSTGDDGKIAILDGDREVALKKGQKLNLPQSVTRAADGAATLSDVKAVTGMGDEFVNLIKKFEGNPDNNFEPYTKAYKDSNGVWTAGYGFTKGVKSNTTMTKSEANQRLAKEYLQIKEDLRIEFGDETFDKIPQPLREGLIDLVFNKGFEALNIEKFSSAINNNNIPQAFEQLIFNRSIKTGEEMNGLYKRSLARLAMVYKEFDTQTQETLKPVIDEFYEKCRQKVSQNELDKWWMPGSGSDKADTSGESIYIVQEGDTGLISIARKFGVRYQDLLVLNKNLEENAVIHPGDKINLPVKGIQTTAETPKEPLADEIINIKKMKLSDEERLKKTEEVFDKYAKYYDIPHEAVELFKEEARDEYNSWLWIDTDNMTVMARILDVQTPEEIFNAYKNAIDESSKSKKFAGFVMDKKINQENIREIIQYSGGTKKFVKMVKKAGGIDVLRHSLTVLIDEKENNAELLKRFEQAAAEEDYTDIIKVFNNAYANTPKSISDELAKTLDKDDDLNSLLYKYQIQHVTGSNVLEVLRSNDIISGICEADNDRKTCKSEIMRLFNILDRNYNLDEEKKKEFINLVNKEFQERKWWKPRTWWIGTSKISKKFKELIKEPLRPKDIRTELYRLIGIPEGTKKLDKLTDEEGNVIPLVETNTPTGDGELNGRRIIINAGHGGYNDSKDDFDPGAQNEELGIDEWLLNRYMAKQLIDELCAKGAEVVLTAGQINTVMHKDFGEDMRISLHADSHEGMRGLKLYTYDKDKKDKNLAENILHRFLSNENASNIKDLNWKEITFHLDMKTDEQEVDRMQAKIIDTSHLLILEERKNKALEEPALLIEYCNIKKNQEVRNIVFGNLGKDIIHSIVDGVIKYYSPDNLASL